MGSAVRGGTVALSSGPRPLFSAQWVAGLAPVAEAAMVATIWIYTSGPRTYDPDTDTWTTSDVTHYEGKTRVQPVRSSRDAANTGDATTLQRVRFQIPAGSLPELRPDMRVQVTESPLNPALLSNLFVVTEMVDSSNPFEQTFEATTNNETVV